MSGFAASHVSESLGVASRLARSSSSGSRKLSGVVAPEPHVQQAAEHVSSVLLRLPSSLSESAPPMKHRCSDSAALSAKHGEPGGRPFSPAGWSCRLSCSLSAQGWTPQQSWAGSTAAPVASQRAIGSGEARRRDSTLAM
eukprot:364716-Chlamydomonas_euryale.AAC.9